jgi:BirA family biotin operon repressor/biotin-[acetyl-CoA-carboxylase] ligase
VAHALEACGVAGVGLKWPNDILLDGGKVGGILIELERHAGRHAGGDRHRPQSATAAVGERNCRNSCIARQHWHRRLSPLPERHQLLAQLLIDLAAVLDAFPRAVSPRCAANGRRVMSGRIVRCVCSTAAARSAGDLSRRRCRRRLLLLTANGVERCLSGDLSLRSHDHRHRRRQ